MQNPTIQARWMDPQKIDLAMAIITPAYICLTSESVRGVGFQGRFFYTDGTKDRGFEVGT